ncbi:hypothetical protein [Iodobacter sp.]|uniref:hypothetical protein n=1 Tax=Iodobacter sp. TaxID=1915058 RepID=UPI0025EC1C42|nr:hypothetical protein [Iodobacter sp.]
MLAIYILIPLAMFAALFYYFSYMPAAQKDWETIPTREGYLAKHPANNMACYKCGDSTQLDIGLLRFTDYRRKKICAKCKTTLWREQD